MILHFVGRASRFVEFTPKTDIGRITGQLDSLKEGQTEKLTIKSLRGKIKELVSGQYRVVFFTVSSDLYIVDVFKKQSRKTPLRILKRAEKLYHFLDSQ